MTREHQPTRVFVWMADMSGNNYDVAQLRRQLDDHCVDVRGVAAAGLSRLGWGSSGG